jgi:photoactive yellow protein
MEFVKFGDRAIENKIARMNEGEVDDLSFGAILLDRNGTILRYNSAEGEITGREPKDVIGKNFFDDVAPCTKSPEFHGRFLQGVESESLNVLFEYNFDYQMVPTRVRVHMKSSITDDNFWVFVKRI